MISTAALLLLLATQHADPLAAPRPSDRAALKFSASGGSVDWSDAEDKVLLAVQPGRPRAGDRLTLTVRLGSFQGPAYDGPVVLALRPPDGRAVLDVPLERKGDAYTGTAVPDLEGSWSVDIRFRTTRAKHLQVELPVEAGRSAAWMELLAMALAAGLVAWLSFRASASRRPAARVAEDAGPAAGEAGPAPPSGAPPPAP